MGHSETERNVRRRLNWSVLAVTLLVWTSTAVTLPAQVGLSLQGTVESSDGSPVSGVSVTARGSFGTVRTAGLTGADGRFRIHDLPPGTYTVEISMEGFSVQRREITLRPGQQAELRFIIDVDGPLSVDEILIVDNEAGSDDQESVKKKKFKKTSLLEDWLDGLGDTGIALAGVIPQKSSLSIFLLEASGESVIYDVVTVEEEFPDGLETVVAESTGWRFLGVHLFKRGYAVVYRDE